MESGKVQVSRDGRHYTVTNGVVAWLNEEEVQELQARVPQSDHVQPPAAEQADWRDSVGSQRLDLGKVDPPGDWSNVDPLEAAKRFGTGFAIGAPATYAGGAIFGGPVGPGIAAVGGAASGIGSVGEYLAEQGVFGETMQGGPQSFGAGLVADIASDIAMRRGLPLATGRTLGREIPGLLRRLSSGSRAVDELEGVGLGADNLGAHGAGGIVEIVKEGSEVLKKRADLAWENWVSAAGDEVLEVAGLKELLVPIVKQGEYGPVMVPVSRIMRQADDTPISAGSLQNLRSEIGAAAAETKNAALKQRLNKAKDAVDEFAQQFEDDAALDALDAARRATREYRYVAETRGPDQLVNKSLLGDASDLADPTQGLHAIFRKPRSGRAVKQMRKAAEAAGRLDEFEAEFKTALMQYLQGTMKGATGSGGSAASASAHLRKLSRHSGLVRDALGDKGYHHIVGELLEPLVRSTRPDRRAMMPSSRGFPTTGAGLLGAGGGFLAGSGDLGSLAMGAGALGAAGLANAARRQFGKTTKRSAALDFLGDPAERAAMLLARETPVGGIYRHPSIALGRRALSSGISGGLSNYERTRER